MSDEMKTAVLGPLPAHNFSNSRAEGGALYTADQMRAYALQERSAERERIKARLLGMDDATSAHNYYAHAAWVLFERA